VLAHVVADQVNRLLSLRHVCGKAEKDMPHVFPDMQLHLQPGARPLDQPHRVVKQTFIVTDNDQQRRQPTQIGIGG